MDRRRAANTGGNVNTDFNDGMYMSPVGNRMLFDTDA
jgi:hypothetical protein